MINYFKSSSLDQNTKLYIDLVRSLKNNKERLKEASEQFAKKSHPSYQKLILKLSLIEGINFNVHGLIITVTEHSINYRYQLGAINVEGYTKRFNDEKVQWSFIPKNKYELSLDIASKSLEGIQGINLSRSGSWLWISGNTFPVKDRIRKSVYGTFLTSGFKKSTKQWYLCPKQ